MKSRTRAVLAALIATTVASTLAIAQPGSTPTTTDSGSAPAPTGSGSGSAPTTTTPPAPTGNGSGSANPVPVQDAPNGPGLGKQPVPTQPTQPAKPVDIKPLTLNAKELEALKDIEGEYERFIQAANEQDTRMRTIAKREFDTRTTDLNNKYADRIAKIEASRSKHHGDTIALLEAFLQNHPAHETFTPDAMFRLADLYLDQADEEVEARLAANEKAPPDPNAPEQTAITADYSKSLALWEQILTKFPNYRQTPSTLYLLAYYGKTKDERKSLQVFLALACANQYKWNGAPPKPPTREEALKRVERKQLRDPYATCQPYPNSEVELIRHAWVRGIADYHFTVPGELDEAIAAYLKVAEGGQDSKLYAESLYKLAWSYYKRDKLEDSIKRFDQSVKLYDQIVAQGGIPALELRDESIQYISVAMTDPWEGETDTNPVKAMERAKAFYKGRENEPHVRDVWVAMGKAFAELQAWDQAVDAYRIAIGPPWELHPNNPVVHQEIVNVFELKGDKYAADNAAAELATKYACPGTAWCQANEHDRVAMDNQRRIAERALYAAARNTHAAATQMRKDYEAAKSKDPAAKQEYLAMYAKAVDLYRQFVNTYPESDYTYEFTYNQGEALYWSERYPEAIVAYTWVRDHRDLGTAFYIDAARSIVQSYEAEAQKLVAEGKLQPLKIPTSAELKALPQPWQPQPIPDIYLKLQAEYDNYQNVVNDPAAAPQQGTNAALISLAYFHIDDAIARFTKVMDKFCGQAYAAKAKDGILAIYEAQSNFDAIEATNKRFINAKCGDKATLDAAIAQNRSLNFSRANALYAEKQYTQAAEAFYRFYKTAPPTDPDLPVALYNAAVSYKLADRPKTAISLFKEFAANPAKNFRESPYYLDALRLQASTYQAAFDYNNAVRTYLDLHATVKKAKQLKIKPPEPLPGEQPRTLDQIGLDALYNAALASELNRDFKKAIDLYKQYGNEEKDRTKLDRALKSIGGIYRQSGDVNSMEETYAKWRARYAKDSPENADFSVQTYYDAAALRKKKGQTVAAKKAGEDTIKEWKRLGATKGSAGAKLAGEWELSFAEDYYASKWEPYEIKKAAKNIKEAEAQGKALQAEKTKAEDQYLKLDQYGVAEMSMAAKVRYAEIQYSYATKLANAPIPTPVANASNPEILEKYQAQLDANVKKYLDEAKAQWIAVLDAAKKGGISNKWSRLAQENLGREFPQEFTVLRQEIVQGTEAP
ncbi:MAG TPA: tetratricopeptide repeat protein [Kofleriaceae bacterium]|nr:tetratricopeptide repeat protein [Kofleriaceae bacterium]